MTGRYKFFLSSSIEQKDSNYGLARLGLAFRHWYYLFPHHRLEFGCKRCGQQLRYFGFQQVPYPYSGWLSGYDHRICWSYRAGSTCHKHDSKRRLQHSTFPRQTRSSHPCERLRRNRYVQSCSMSISWALFWHSVLMTESLAEQLYYQKYTDFSFRCRHFPHYLHSLRLSSLHHSSDCRRTDWSCDRL